MPSRTALTAMGLTQGRFQPLTEISTATTASGANQRVTVFSDFADGIYGQVSCAVPKIFSGCPPSGFIGVPALPAMI